MRAELRVYCEIDLECEMEGDSEEIRQQIKDALMHDADVMMKHLVYNQYCDSKVIKAVSKAKVFQKIPATPEELAVAFNRLDPVTQNVILVCKTIEKYKQGAVSSADTLDAITGILMGAKE